MAWVDDRIWCHQKLADLSDRAYRVLMNGIAYSSGFQTKGCLTVGHQRLIGATPKMRGELLTAGLWDENGDAGISIHDWDAHNGKRDERRTRDRERKRLERDKQYGGGNP